MRSAENIKNVFKNLDLDIDINPKTDRKILGELLEAQQKSKEMQPAFALPNLRRTIMKSPLTKLTVAAVLAIACVTGLILWTGTGSGVALADVLARIEQASVYMYQMSITGQTKERPLSIDVQSTVLISHDHGMKMSMEFLDPNSGERMLQEQYMLPQKKRMIMIMPSQKKYTELEIDDTLVERTQKQNNDPRTMVKRILECDYKSLGMSTIDGIEVEGFQTTDPHYLGGILGDVDVKIWVDVKTQLPVRSEMNMQMDRMDIHAVIYDFQWDASVDAAEFEPFIPDDYTMFGGAPIKMAPFNEETAIQGLRLFSKLSGKFPEELSLTTLMPQFSKLKDSDDPSVKQLFEHDKDLTEEERVKKLMDIMIPIQGLGTFYMRLFQDKKDPAYYGKSVAPEDTDQVLMRWKVSDNEYRVIFGDLHTETVTAEVLAELEKPLLE